MYNNSKTLHVCTHMHNYNDTYVHVHMYVHEQEFAAVIYVHVCTYVLTYTCTSVDVGCCGVSLHKERYYTCIFKVMGYRGGARTQEVFLDPCFFCE